MNIGLVYAGLLALGVVYALLAAAMGWFSELHVGDIHVDAGDLDAGHAHPLSGTIVATFITGFGAAGVVAHYLLDWSTLAGLLTATTSGLVLSGAAFGVLELIFSQTQAGSEFTAGDVVGRTAEVITPIPADGCGEIAYVVKGQRVRASARTGDGSAIPKGRLVLIDRIDGPTAHVRLKD
ncbi:MAG: hypothetical protein GY856_49440 [bacterium]|nr:hypothetical protein [bacterium]